MTSLGRARKPYPENAADILPRVVPEPWKSTLGHLRTNTERLSKADIFSCLSFFERPESWIFFIVDEGASMPPILNLDLHRHVVFAIMLKHWVVVHVDLVNFQAAYLDPKISPISSHPARLRELLVRWLEVQLDHGKIDQKLKLIEKKCEQHDDSSVVAILNIVALARGYSLAADIDTAHHRTRLIDRLETVTVSSKPGRRLKQWTNHNGLRTADTMFTGRSPASGLSTTGSTSSPDKDESSESKSLWDWLMGPDAVSIPQAPTSNKRKTEASSATAGAPAKRRRAEDSTEEQSSYWPCPAWWGKDDGLDDVHKATEQLRKELDMARADIWAIVSKLNKIEQRNGPL